MFVAQEETILKAIDTTRQQAFSPPPDLRDTRTAYVKDKQRILEILFAVLDDVRNERRGSIDERAFQVIEKFRWGTQL